MNSLFLPPSIPSHTPLPFPSHTPLHFPSHTPSPKKPHRFFPIQCCNNIEIDMVKTKQGTYTAKQNKVVILWDLDNKPPRGPPYNAALSLKCTAELFGDVVQISAYANRHTFIHLPQWVRNQRTDRKTLDILERKKIIIPTEPYVCTICGRKCKTNSDLKKHFKQLHVREREKKMNRLSSLKGKKRQRFKERFISGDEKYNDMARGIVNPRVGYGLAAELRRAGVFVKTVEDKPQAADWALKKQMMHSMSRGIDWLVLVSDDSDFSEMLRKARVANLGTVVVGDMDRALGRHADFWVSWNAVENGEIGDMDLVPKDKERRRSSNTRRRDGFDDGLFLDEDEELEEDYMLVYSDDEYTTDEEDDDDGVYIY